MIYVTIKYPSMSIGLVVVSFKYTAAHLSIKAERTPGSFPLAFFQSLFSCDPLGMLRRIAFPEAFNGGFQIYIFFFFISKCTVNACQIPGRLCNCRTYKSIFLRKLQAPLSDMGSLLPVFPGPGRLHSYCCPPSEA